MIILANLAIMVNTDGWYGPSIGVGISLRRTVSSALPRRALKLYFLNGRFETLAGHQEPVRIKTTSADEERNAGALKEALVSLKI